MMDRVLTNDVAQPSYPPYNIEKTDADTYRISVAVAGFSEEDLSVEVKENALIVAGKKGAILMVEGGASEVVELSGRCLVAVQTGLNQVRYASLKGIMAAKKKPLEELDAADFAPASTVASMALPPERPPSKILGEGADAVSALIDALKNEAKVL